MLSTTVVNLLAFLAPTRKWNYDRFIRNYTCFYRMVLWQQHFELEQEKHLHQVESCCCSILDLKKGEISPEFPSRKRMILCHHFFRSVVTFCPFAKPCTWYWEDSRENYQEAASLSTSFYNFFCILPYVI